MQLRLLIEKNLGNKLHQSFLSKICLEGSIKPFQRPRLLSIPKTIIKAK